MRTSNLVKVYIHQRKHGVDGSIYKLTQCDFAYNSNHLEGSKLTSDQTRMIYDRNKVSGNGVDVDDIIETKNHFELFDYMLDTYKEPLTDEYVKTLHRILKQGTRQSKNPIDAVGNYKVAENTIGEFVVTAKPEEVPVKMHALFQEYEAKAKVSEKDLIDFHYQFERIHPFSDGNGRVGRMIMFKECLRNNITPFIIEDNLRDFYIRGLREYQNEPGFLVDTCLTAQDKFTAAYLPLAKSYWRAMEEVSL